MALGGGRKGERHQSSSRLLAVGHGAGAVPYGDAAGQRKGGLASDAVLLLQDRSLGMCTPRILVLSPLCTAAPSIEEHAGCEIS